MAAVSLRCSAAWRFVRGTSLFQLSMAPVGRIHSSAPPNMGVSVQQFEEAKNKVSTLHKDPGNQVKLQMYALFKQATQGPCNTTRPGLLDFVNKAKWEAWNSLGTLTQSDARQQYCDLIGSLVEAEQPAGGSSVGGASVGGASVGGASYDTLQVTKDGGVTTITLNRPHKKNAITNQMYNELTAALQQAADDDSVLTVMTGAGDFFCSGNDLNNFSPDGRDREQMAEDGAKLLRNYVRVYIDFPKPLVAVVNGPAVGISVTVLGLFDLVYATERATFHTPFSQLGQSPEGCSSYTFPKMMGTAKSSEVLLMNQKLSAHEACALGLVSQVFPDSSFQTEVWSRIREYAKLPPQALHFSKQLIRRSEREQLHAANEAEVECLRQRWLSDECLNAIMAFFQAKAKL